VQEFARTLTESEARLRAAGLTGANAFVAVCDAVRAAMGDDRPVHPALEGLALHPAGRQSADLLGLAYERFFPELFKGRVGQFFTPPPLVQLLLSRIDLRPGMAVLDPTCGSGAMLVHAGRAADVRVRGVDVDPNLVALAELNLRLAGVPAEVEQADFFAMAPDEPVDVVLANPPFSVPIRDPDVLGRYEMGHDRARQLSDVLFLEALERWLAPGGVAGLVVPWTLIANASMAPVRERIDRHFRRRALLRLPEGVFRPFGGAAGSAALLWLERSEGTAQSEAMAWATLTDPGYDTRSTAWKATDPSEVEARCDGEGWSLVSGWMPAAQRGSVPPLASWMAVDSRSEPARATLQADLADTDRQTGELLPRDGSGRGRRAVLEGGQVLVARMRPALGNVSLVPDGVEAQGSPEWIRLRPEHHPHYAFHALKSPAWRAQLPPTTGQTRPRTDADTVLATGVPLPPEPVLDRIEALSSRLLETRRVLRERLVALQDAVDAFVAGELSEAELDSRLAALEDG
jgi:protein-L-isoaspartate O-methyltransferase